MKKKVRSGIAGLGLVLGVLPLRVLVLLVRVLFGLNLFVQPELEQVERVLGRGGVEEQEGARHLLGGDGDPATSSAGRRWGPSRRPARTLTARWPGCRPGSTPVSGDPGHRASGRAGEGEDAVAAVACAL